MKKIISSLIVCVMLLGIIAPCSFASEQTAYGDKVVFYSPNVKANPGEDFVLEVNVRDNPGICTYHILLEYDPSVLDVTSRREGERFVIKNSVIPGMSLSNSKYEENKVMALSVYTDNIFDDGNLFGYRFTVKENAPQTVTKIKVILKEIVHYDANGGTNAVYDLFDGKEESYDVSVAINTTQEIAGVSEAEFKCLTETEFAATYQERVEANKEAIEAAKPTPKPIEATPKPEKPDASESEDSTIKVVRNKDVAGYMAPVSENVFEPDRKATRYEVVAALDKIFTVKNAADKDDFSDVSAEYKKAVNEFAQVGIINGYPDGTFGGERNITRAEFVKLLSVALGLDFDVAGKATLNDVEGHWAERQIKAFVHSGYIMGYPDGSFKPDDNITRAEVVAIINRVLSIKDLAEADAKFADLDKNHWAFYTVMAIYK